MRPIIYFPSTRILTFDPTAVQEAVIKSRNTDEPEVAVVFAVFCEVVSETELGVSIAFMFKFKFQIN